MEQDAAAELPETNEQMILPEKEVNPKQRNTRRLVGVGVVLVLIIVIAIAAILNRQGIYDMVRGWNYQPTAEMAKIRDSLGLTGRGEFLFKAAQPVLSESEEFNEHCRDGGDTEMAVLGCYREDNIYVYNITAAELNGIRELTTAHELLHVVWARMSDGAKAELAADLEKVLGDNQDWLEEEITTYNEDERQEELYVRVGTELANLPERLEKHYGEIFANQDAVVGFYDQYITVFREIEKEMEALKDEMGEIRKEMEALIAEYEKQSGQLDADIVSFNSCAKVAGCFKSEEEFYDRRNKLLADQERLAEMYEQVSESINRYNVLVEQYNADVTQSQKLNQVINSYKVPSEIK